MHNKTKNCTESTASLIRTVYFTKEPKSHQKAPCQHTTLGHQHITSHHRPHHQPPSNLEIPTSCDLVTWSQSQSAAGHNWSQPGAAVCANGGVCLAPWRRTGAGTKCDCDLTSFTSPTAQIVVTRRLH